MKYPILFCLLSACNLLSAQDNKTPCGDSVNDWFLGDKAIQWRQEIPIAEGDSFALDSARIRAKLIDILESDGHIHYIKDTFGEITFMIADFEVDFSALGYTEPDILADWWNTSFEAYCSINYYAKKFVIAAYKIHSHSSFEAEQAFMRPDDNYTYTGPPGGVIFKKNGCLRNNKKEIINSLEGLGKAFSNFFLPEE